MVSQIRLSVFILLKTSAGIILFVRKIWQNDEKKSKCFPNLLMLIIVYMNVEIIYWEWCDYVKCLYVTALTSANWINIEISEFFQGIVSKT